MRRFRPIRRAHQWPIAAQPQPQSMIRFLTTSRRKRKRTRRPAGNRAGKSGEEGGANASRIGRSRAAAAVPAMGS